MRVLFATLLLIGAAQAHDNYPQWCCYGNDQFGDCKPIDCDAITETREGYDWEKLHFSPDRTFPSPDRQCHACVHNNVPQCLFIQPSS